MEIESRKRQGRDTMAQGKKKGVSADAMFFDDIDEEDEEFDFDDMGDIEDMLGDDIDLDSIELDDLDDMLSENAGEPSGGSKAKSRGGSGQDEGGRSSSTRPGRGSSGDRSQAASDRDEDDYDSDDYDDYDDDGGVGGLSDADLDDETLLEADLAAAEGRGGRRRGNGGSGDAGKTAGKDAGRGSGRSTKASADAGRASSQDRKRGQQTQKAPAKSERYAQDYYDEQDYEGGYDDAGEAETEQLVVPDWVVSINSKLQGNVAHAFLLEGNIRDYMVRNVAIKDGIIQTLDPYQDAFDVIASYDQAHGLTFDTSSITDEVSPDDYKARFIELMNEAQADLDMPVSNEIPRDPVTIFSIISKIMEMPGEILEDGNGGEFERAKMLLFVDYPEMLVPQTNAAPRESERQLAIIINDLCRSELADQSGCCIIMMTDDTTSMSERIRSTSSRVDRVNVPMPKLEMRQDFIDNVLGVPENILSDGRHIFECEEGVSAEYLAINTAGLACFQIEDIVLRALADDTPITPQLVKERKNEIITTDYDDVLEILDPKYGFNNVGGMQQMKEFFFDEVINPIHRGELEAVPMGVLFMGPPGSGKSLPRLTPLPTPKGWRKAGEIEVGDQLFGSDGKPTAVTAVYTPGVKEIYKVTLRDGREVECSGDHLWYVGRKAHGRIKWETMTVDEMLSRGIYSPNSDGTHNHRSKFFVPEAHAVEYPEAELPVDPYVLGCFLGDGCRNPGRALEFSSADEFIVSTIASTYGCTPQRKKDSYSWHFVFGPDDVKEYGRKCLRVSDITHDEECCDLMNRCYAGDKYIPERYMLASYDQRIELLQGLMDTDGSIRRAGGRYNIGFATTSPRLAHDVNLLAHSLGWASSIARQARAGRPITNHKNPMITERGYKHQSDLYEVRIRPCNAEKELLFRLPRKKEIAREVKDVADRRQYGRIAIAGIEPTGRSEDTVCFTVDAPDSLYLVGNYVVTHNTMLAKAIAHESNMNCVNLNLNRILNKFVGGSERNLDRALDCAMAMQPTIIFIDEIDEALPKRNGADQTGISQRINKRLLEFFSQTEHRGQVMILAATNYPEKIDPAFKRAGRFDNRLPMFAPGKYDRSRILHISAGKAQYTISSFIDPDTLIMNPFRTLRHWLEQGNTPNLENSIYDMTDFEFTMKDSLNRPVRMRTQIPKRLARIVDKPKISLEEFYRSCEILFSVGEMPSRGGDEVGEAVLTDEQYHDALVDFFAMNSGIFGNDKRVYEFCAKWILYREVYYDQFGDLTVGKTGAELDVVINKCISLYRTFKAEQPERFKEMLDKHLVTGERDLPWAIVLEACSKTTAAVSGIKSMEDFALIDTSDTDYIPDEEYGRLSSNKTISYRERQEQLLTRMKLLAGDNENTAELLKA